MSSQQWWSAAQQPSAFGLPQQGSSQQSTFAAPQPMHRADISAYNDTRLVNELIEKERKAANKILTDILGQHGSQRH